MDRGAWWATVHGVTKQLDMTRKTLHFKMFFARTDAVGFSRQEYWSGVPLPSPPVTKPAAGPTAHHTAEPVLGSPPSAACWV